MVLISLLLSFALADNVHDRLPVETIIGNAPAQNNGPCTEWVKDTSVSCVLKNGSSSTMWRRDCEHVWDYESICTVQNPNKLPMVCTEWQKNHSVECVNGSTQLFRQCQDIRYKLTYCPNNFY